MTPALTGAVAPRDLISNPVLARWISVRTDGVFEIRVGKVELGQGLLTALAQLAADELDVELVDIRMLAANTRTGPDEGVTSGSTSVAECGLALRVVAANVRALFVAEAARRWRVDPAEVAVDRGVFTTAGSSPSTSYAALASAFDLEVDADLRIPVKTVDQQRIAGTSSARLDLPDKVAGRARYIHDLRLPGQLFGRVVRPPSPGAKLVHVDEAMMAGADVVVVRDGSFLGLIGADEALVVRKAESLRAAATWDEWDTYPDEDALDAYLRRGPHETIPLVDDDHVEGPSGRSIRATYGRPFIAHASIAPSCGVARWEPDGSLAVWSHSQGIGPLKVAIAGVLQLDPLQVVVEHAEGAGCYGHNGADDAAFDAVLLARKADGRPVQVQWSREDELTWSPFGSAMAADVEATVDDSGKITSWSYDVWSQGHTSRPGTGGSSGLLAATSMDPPATYHAPSDPPLARGGGTTRNAVPIYSLPRRRVVGHRLIEASVRSSALRALGAYLNVFAIESFMDELALLVGQDALTFRLAHLADERARRVLEAAARAAHWGEPTAEGVGRGLGLARYKDGGAYCAVVAEVAAETEIRLLRLTIAVDVGRVVNPDGVRNQIEGGATQSASWTLKERVRFDRRRVTSRDWESYPILRFSEAPEITVELLHSAGAPSVGAGEAAQGPTAGAIANAVTDAVGVRVRQLPLTSAAVIAAIESQT
jgi:nicotinate dehydrogenase subunit B